jgi:perosamine synthetase
MKPIPLCKALIESEELQAVEDVLKSGWLTHGPKTTEFEILFAESIGVKHAVAMNSCTSALYLALLANEIDGDVLVPSFTFVASANAIITAGATPVFVDINYHDCNVDADRLGTYLTPKTQALMVVHYAGQSCDMGKIEKFVRKHGLILIEDSAETIGGTFMDRKTGSWGIGCFSFFPTKNITTGEGGMLTTNDDALAQKIRALIGHGIDKSTLQRQKETKSWHRVARYAGYNFRLSNILAAIGVEQIKKLGRMNDARRELSFHLIDRLKDVEELDLPSENHDAYHVFQMFTVKIKNGKRDEVVVRLKKMGIEASVHFAPPLHYHPAYQNYKNITLPVTEQVADRIFTLPMFPQMTLEETNRIANAVKSCIVK